MLCWSVAQSPGCDPHHYKNKQYRQCQEDKERQALLDVAAESRELSTLEKNRQLSQLEAGQPLAKLFCLLAVKWCFVMA